jgi:hypothetical protein
MRVALWTVGLDSPTAGHRVLLTLNLHQCSREYEPFLYLLKQCHITESGGIQEEAHSLCKPVVAQPKCAGYVDGIDCIAFLDVIRKRL